MEGLCLVWTHIKQSLGKLSASHTGQTQGMSWAQNKAVRGGKLRLRLDLGGDTPMEELGKGTVRVPTERFSPRHGLGGVRCEV